MQQVDALHEAGSPVNDNYAPIVPGTPVLELFGLKKNYMAVEA